ncbi:hypothetical protein B8V81_2407 [Paenibacillus pasadenensis]|uniref:Uncharacterized protein n=1 Tax=Paenibacillus pasadenensis TaxID=217090 RepID=A0A2N5N0X3_9BACL|nr:hypothetical protein B8V81_2407 [Paenibacillus pasadenensis]
MGEAVGLTAAAGAWDPAGSAAAAGVVAEPDSRSTASSIPSALRPARLVPRGAFA